MKKIILLATTFISSFACGNENINEEWHFIKQESCADAHTPSIDESQWDVIDLPHTFNPSGSFDVYRDRKAEVIEQASVWYRKNIFIDEKLKSKRLFFRFGASYIDTDFYINAQHIGNHKGGYSAFIFEITDKVEYGKENVFSVNVNNKYNPNINPLGGGYVKFGGITRPVELIVKEKTCISPLHFASSGVYFKPKSANEKLAQGEVEVLISGGRNVDVVCSILDDKGNIVAKEKSSTNKDSVVIPIEVENPNLWQGKASPALYTLKVELFQDGKLLDVVNETIGFRSFEIDKDKGFFLNGKHYPLYGVAQHQYFPKVGSAMLKEHFDSDMEQLLDLGATAIRLSHYPHSQYRLEQCDKHGIVVFSEIAFIKEFFGTQEFSDDLVKQVNEMVYQLYNHPSIAIWGLFNEIRYDDFKGVNVMPIVERINETAKKADPARYSAGVSWKEGSRNDVADLSAWNRYQGWYWNAYVGDVDDFSWIDNIRREYPNRLLGITEYGGGGATNHFDENRKIAPYNLDQFHPVDFYNYSQEEHWKQIVKRPWLWGTFVWTMSEFLVPTYDQGRTTFLHNKGLIAEGNTERKDAYYFYKANWRKDTPVFHLAYKKFDLRFNDDTEITVYSNLSNAKLTVNGIDMGELKNAPFGIYRWQVQLQNGDNKIEVTSTDENKNTYKESATWHLISDINDSEKIEKIISHGEDWKVKFFEKILESKGRKGTGVPGEEINSKFDMSSGEWKGSGSWAGVSLPLIANSQVAKGNWEGKMVMLAKDFEVGKDIENAHIYLKQTASLSNGNGGRISIAIDGKNVFTNEQGSQEYRFIPIYERLGTLKKGKHTISIIAIKPEMGGVLDVGLYSDKQK